MRKINLLASMVILIFVSAFLAGAGTLAWFSDTEKSKGNTFTAGSIDLKLDGGDSNVVKFTVTNMHPGSQPKGTFVLSNVGTLTGYLDLENIKVVDYENGRIEPEKEAGDPTGGNPGKGKGELSQVVNVRLFVDYDCDGWISAGDNVFYNGLVCNLPASFDLNEPIPAGGSINIVAIFDWWSTPMDSQAMTDSMEISITFELGQTASQ